MIKRRDKGLCYYCDDKFRPGHHCKTENLFMLVGQTSFKDDDMDCSDDPPSSDDDALEILLHAMTGAPTPQTMRVTGLLGRPVISILIDTGSTHNFLDPHLAKKNRSLSRHKC
ncbi:hypothetical protein Pint_05186 [Pistacia integerrima]|uniref:Uncharacterized protein n=1 Tax=Pistacia integerrima TaxID=434235 RepID=A0ACC0Z2J0_9ROSI|nr:hypothetical protein Pint_05186 [Pistacia integerrima]